MSSRRHDKGSESETLVIVHCTVTVGSVQHFYSILENRLYVSAPFLLSYLLLIPQRKKSRHCMRNDLLHRYLGTVVVCLWSVILDYLRHLVYCGANSTERDRFIFSVVIPELWAVDQVHTCAAFGPSITD